jgi:hypothetical protein
MLTTVESIMRHGRRAAGFELAGIFPISCDARNHVRLEADRFFVRR